MMTAWLIGLILSFLGIYLYKGSRTQAREGTWNKPAEPERSILKVWSLLLCLLGAIVPILNIFMGLVMIVYWAIAVHGDETWVYPETSIANKIVQFFNKSIQ